MNCNFTEKISLLIDGELSREEVGLVEKHLAGCLICRQAQEDFLRLRQQIASYDFAHESFAGRQALHSIVAAQNIPVWKRRLSIPAPVFALLVMALVAVAAWAVSMRAARKPGPGLAVQPATSAPAPGGVEAAQGGIDFSRYDNGARAIIYTVRRASESSSQ